MAVLASDVDPAAEQYEYETTKITTQLPPYVTSTHLGMF